jgi:hypothetical protein
VKGALAGALVGGLLVLGAVYASSLGRPADAPRLLGATPVAMTRAIGAVAPTAPALSPSAPTELTAAELDVGQRAGVPVHETTAEAPVAAPAAVVEPSVVPDGPTPTSAQSLPVLPQMPTLMAPQMPMPMALQMPMPMAPQMPMPSSMMAQLATMAPPPNPARPEAPVENMGPSPAPLLDPRPFAEAHWQGLEAVPKTPTLAAALKIPPDLDGVILDDVTLPGDLQGFRAGDLVTAVDGVPTPNLVAFIRASDRVRDQRRVDVDIVRAGAPRRIELVALMKRLGTANGETPGMIPPGARSPHPYMGPCLNCHRIGTTGNLAADQGDNLRNAPGPVRLTDPAPHRDRGACAACHPIIP